MIFNALTAAAMLLAGTFMPSFELRTYVEPTAVYAQFEQSEKLLPETLRILIEEHGAPYWDISASLAWEYYYNGLISIEEIEPEIHYVLHFEGILDIVLTDEE